MDAKDRENQEQSRQGTRTDIGHNVTEVKAPTGNSQSKGLRKLRKDRPDLHKLVIEEKMTVHAAMLEAGLRHNVGSEARQAQPRKA